MVTAPYVPPIGQEERLERLAGLSYTDAAYDASGDLVRVGHVFLSTDAADRLIRFCEASGRFAGFPPARDMANLAGSAEAGDERTADDVFQEWAHRCSAER